MIHDGLVNHFPDGIIGGKDLALLDGMMEMLRLASK